MPIGLSPPLILTLCGPERVLVVSTEPPDDLSCLTTPGVGRPGDGLLPRAVDQVHPDAPSESVLRGGGLFHVPMTLHAAIRRVKLPSLPRKRGLCTLLPQTFCERRPGPCSALDKLFSHSCELHVLRVVLKSRPTTHVTGHTIPYGGGGVRDSRVLWFRGDAHVPAVCGWPRGPPGRPTAPRTVGLPFLLRRKTLESNERRDPEGESRHGWHTCRGLGKSGGGGGSIEPPKTGGGSFWGGGGGWSGVTPAFALCGHWMGAACTLVTRSDTVSSFVQLSGAPSTPGLVFPAVELPVHCRQRQPLSVLSPPSHAAMHVKSHHPGGTLYFDYQVYHPNKVAGT